MIWSLIAVIFLYNLFAQWIIAIFAFIIVFMAISYLKPSKEWGRLLFYTRRTLEEKLCAAVFIGIYIYIMIDASQHGWNDSVLYTGNPGGIAWVPWVKVILALMVVIGLGFLPNRVFEKGFRDGIRFESWDCVETMGLQENGRVKITLKKPTLRRTVYLNLKPGDELPEAALERSRVI